MKEVWFYLFYDYAINGCYKGSFKPELTRLLVSNEFDSFDEAWESMQSRKFPASPIMKGYIKDE